MMTAAVISFWIPARRGCRCANTGPATRTGRWRRRPWPAGLQIMPGPWSAASITRIRNGGHSYAGVLTVSLGTIISSEVDDAGMNDYDKAGRYQVKRDPEGFFRWLFGNPGLSFQGWLD